MSSLTSQRTRLYLALVLYVLASFLLTIDVLQNGDGEVEGPLALSFVIGLFFIPLTRGHAWAKWLLVVVFTVLAIMAYLAYTEHHGLEELLLIGCYLLLGYITYGFKSKSKLPSGDASAIHVDVLDSSFITAPVETAVKDERSYRYPVVLTRYKASFIDTGLFLFVMVVTMVVFGDSEYRSPVMISLAAVFFLIYNPLLIVFSATVGQRVMNIRVRSYDDPSQPIQLWQSYLRIVVKAGLGWISLISVLINSEKRAIHDLIATSVVVEHEGNRP